MSPSLASFDKLGDRLVVASISGGKDSTALALALHELEVPHVRVFADYRRVITYTLASEPGTSLRAAGWQQTATVRGRSWHCPSRPRQGGVLADKRRWEAAFPPRHAPQDAGGPR